MKLLLTQIKLKVETKSTPPAGTSSRLIFDELLNGVKRTKLRLINENYHGSPLQNIEGEKYGYWLVDRYTDKDGFKCLKLNKRHLTGNIQDDLAARRIRRKERALFSFNKAKKEEKRIPKAWKELNKAQKAYLLSLGDAVNDHTIKGTKPKGTQS